MDDRRGVHSVQSETLSDPGKVKYVDDSQWMIDKGYILYNQVETLSDPGKGKVYGCFPVADRQRVHSVQSGERQSDPGKVKCMDGSQWFYSLCI